MQGMLPATWEDITTVFKPDQPFSNFTNAQIVEYFVTRTVSDGLHVADLKSINKSALTYSIVDMYRTLKFLLTTENYTCEETAYLKCVRTMSINYSSPWVLLPMTYYLHNAVVVVERALILPVNTLLPYAMHVKIFVSISLCRTTSPTLNNCNNGTDLVQNTSSQLQLLTSRNIKTPSANPRY